MQLLGSQNHYRHQNFGFQSCFPSLLSHSLFMWPGTKIKSPFPASVGDAHHSSIIAQWLWKSLTRAKVFKDIQKRWLSNCVVSVRLVALSVTPEEPSPVCIPDFIEHTHVFL